MSKLIAPKLLAMLLLLQSAGASASSFSPLRITEYSALNSAPFLDDSPAIKVVFDGRNRVWFLGQKSLWVLGLLDQQLIKIKIDKRNYSAPTDMSLFGQHLLVANKEIILDINLNDLANVRELKTPAGGADTISLLTENRERPLWVRDHDFVSLDLPGSLGESEAHGIELRGGEFPYQVEAFDDGIAIASRKAVYVSDLKKRKISSTPLGMVEALYFSESVGLLAASRGGVHFWESGARSWRELPVEGRRHVVAADLSKQLHCFLLSDHVLERHDFKTSKSLYYDLSSRNLGEVAFVKCHMSQLLIRNPEGIKIFHLSDVH
jgi:hypothetical protein